LPIRLHPDFVSDFGGPHSAPSSDDDDDDEDVDTREYKDATLNPNYESSEDWDTDACNSWVPPDNASSATAPTLEDEEGDWRATKSGDWTGFEAQLQQTWSWDDEWSFSTQVDEVFLGALIASTLKHGYSLMEISSDGTHHHLRFEQIETASRLVYRVTYLTDTLPVAKVMGHRASVIFGYGERLTDCAVDVPLTEAERYGLEAMPAPGTLVLRGEEGTEYIYAKVELTLDISRFVHGDYSVDTDLLAEHVRVTSEALQAYLRNRAS
jgi:hypothetical protein